MLCLQRGVKDNHWRNLDDLNTQIFGYSLKVRSPFLARCATIQCYVNQIKLAFEHSQDMAGDRVSAQSYEMPAQRCTHLFTRTGIYARRVPHGQ